MSLDTYTAIAEPSRRKILDRLLLADASVAQLVAAVGLPQPAVSKHLRVLRQQGLVRVRGDAQRRIYALDPRPLGEVDAWLACYRQLWNRRIDRLEAHLEQQAARGKGEST